MQILALHVATEPRLVNTARPKLSGIYKTSVRNADVDEDGVIGDHVVDTKHHGGPDQAVYLYAEDDYAWWRNTTGLDIAHGVFGENITVDTFSGNDDLMVGDRFCFDGGVTLEVTSSRIPCDTFSARMARPDWIREFRDARRPGVYCRVIAGGPIRADEHGSIARYEGPTVSMLETQDLFYDSARDVTAERLQTALAAPIDVRSRTSHTAALEGLRSS